MPRLIKRYGSRKLYDTRDSRYVSLDELAGWVREGQQLQVVDNRSGDDVTAAILTQIISEEGRRGESLLSSGFLHNLVRFGENTLKAGEEAVETRIKQARDGAGALVQKSLDKLKPTGSLGEMRDEMARLRERLEALESSLDEFDDEADAPESSS
ncbi:MAG: hypothetical protein HKN04_05550 [Rhodothermaceae bacterium]|nr:hypothetical protein [Rhodothermaceae bacterium]